MKGVPFAAVTAVVSRLGFGCAPVMGRVGRRQSIDAMSTAFDHGVTHFDVARSYGFGDAERVLGEFVRGKRDKVTLTTKFGVVPPELSAIKRALRPVVRQLRAVAAPVKRLVQSRSHGLLNERCFEVAYARACLEKSLRELQTDYVDFYLLHEPDTGQLDGFDDLSEFMERNVASGTIRAWGVAQLAGATGLSRGDDCGSVIQIESPLCSGASGRVAEHDTRMRFVTRPLAGGGDLGALSLQLNAVMKKLDLTVEQAAFALALTEAGPSGAVVAGMFNRDHIVNNVKAVEFFETKRASVESIISLLRSKSGE